MHEGGMESNWESTLSEDEFTHIPPGAREVSEELAIAAVPHSLEVYQGNHGNQVRERVEPRTLPWFSKQLKLMFGDLDL